MPWITRTAIVAGVIICFAALLRVAVLPVVLGPLLIDALQWYDLPKARMLLWLGASTSSRNRFGATALHVLVGKRTGPLFTKEKEQELLSMAQLLVDHGADVRSKADRGYAPIHRAYKPAIVQLLVESGADVNDTTAAGETALHGLVSDTLHGGESLESARILVSHGAQVNVASVAGETPLHRAAYFNNLAAAQFLLSNGADVSKGAGGPVGTPLHSAGVNGDYRDMAQLLVEHGARVESLDSKGLTPRQIAERRNNARVVEYLGSIEANSKKGVVEK